MKNYYKILGLKSGSTLDEVEKKYNDLLKEFGYVTYVPDITKEELKSTLFETKTKYLFTNPNKQPFILDEEVLKDSSIKVINTCSTGTNESITC